MNGTSALLTTPQWFAIKTRNDFRAEQLLRPHCDEVYFPKETVISPGHAPRERAIIPRVLFIRTTIDEALRLEQQGRSDDPDIPPFWIYRYPQDRQIQVIPPRSIALLRLLTVDDTTRCEIFHKRDFREGQHVRVTGGPYEGYEGFVQRVRRNRHVVVRIEGICLIMLPFIHPDLLQPID